MKKFVSLGAAMMMGSVLARSKNQKTEAEAHIKKHQGQSHQPKPQEQVVIVT
jgi:hypothetical protein